MGTRIGSSGTRSSATSRPRLQAHAWLVVGVLASVGCARGIDPGADTGVGPGDDVQMGTDASMDVRVDAPPACSGSCTLPHSTAMCVSGMCSVSHCDPGYADLNHMPGDGCECQVGMNSSQCASATDQGTVNVGSMHMVTGVIAAPGMDQWVRATFVAGGHEHIAFMTNPGMSLHFDVVSTCATGASSSLMCMDRSTGSTGLTDWEFFDAPPDGGMQGDGGVGDDGGPQNTPYPTTVYIRIFTMTAPTGCTPYTLVISN